MPKRLPDRVNNRSIASNKTFVEKHQKTPPVPSKQLSVDMQKCVTIFSWIEKDKTLRSCLQDICDLLWGKINKLLS